MHAPNPTFQWHNIFNTQKHGNRYANYSANAFIMRVLSCLYETYFLTGNSTLTDDKLSNVTKQNFFLLNKENIALQLA